MAYNIGKLVFFILFFLPAKIFANPLVFDVNSKKTFIFILIIIVAFFFIGLLMILTYFINIKKENSLGIYLNLESMWNSPGMIDARHNAPFYITEKLIISDLPNDLSAVKNARFILDFFNHIGIQVYQGLIDFSYVYNLLGNEIIDYWDNRNYRYLAYYEKTKNSPFHNKYEGVEYLVALCSEQNSYIDKTAYFLNTTTNPIHYKMNERAPSYRDISVKNSQTGSLNILLIISSILAGFVFIIFIYFYFNYLFNV